MFDLDEGGLRPCKLSKAHKCDLSVPQERWLIARQHSKQNPAQKVTKGTERRVETRRRWKEEDWEVGEVSSAEYKAVNALKQC